MCQRINLLPLNVTFIDELLKRSEKLEHTKGRLKRSFNSLEITALKN